MSYHSYQCGDDKMYFPVKRMKYIFKCLISSIKISYLIFNKNFGLGNTNDKWLEPLPEPVGLFKTNYSIGVRIIVDLKLRLKLKYG